MATFAQKIADLALAGNLLNYVVPDAALLARNTQGYGSGYFINPGQTNPVAAVIDGDAAKFIVPTSSSQGASGQIYVNFTEDKSVLFGGGESFTVQCEQKFDRFLFDHTFLIEPGHFGGWKQFIIGEGDPPTCIPSNTSTCSSSHSPLEMVVQNSSQRGYPAAYNDVAGSSTPWEEPLPPFDFKMQNGVPGCLYSDGGVGCHHYSVGLANPGDQVTRWGVWTVETVLGPLVSDNYVGSNIKIWVSWAGSAAVKLFDWTTNLPSAGGRKYGTAWFLPYHSFKDATEIHQETYMWTRNIIIARGVNTVPLTTDEFIKKVKLRRS